MLTVIGSFNSWGIAGALQAQAGTGPVVIDLTETTFVEPCGLVTIAALADRAVREGSEVIFKTPNSFQVRNYLSRMGMTKVLDDLGITHNLPVVNINPLPGDLLELRRFSSQFDGEELAKLVFEKVATSGADAQVPDALHASLCELAANVTTHAQVEHGYAAAQTFGKGNSQRITFAVADGGQGVEAAISSAHSPKDAGEALGLAIKQGVSGTGEPGRGTGLPDVVESTISLGGSFFLMSGSAKLITTSANSVTCENTVSVYPGTLIQAEINCRP